MSEKLKVLVACEYSGRVRDAFIELGHCAISADLLPSERPGPHYQGDVLEILDLGWDLMIAHPPCTRLANSGVRWLHERDLWDEMRAGAAFFKALWEAPIPKIAVENPIPHKYAISEIGSKYTQIVQPWMFGHGETKATCFWLKNLPELKPTEVVDGRKPKIHYMSPGKDRAKKRSLTYLGIAKALADQYGGLVEPKSVVE